MTKTHTSINRCWRQLPQQLRPQVDLSLPARRPDTVSPACFITCWMMPRFRSPGIIATPTAATKQAKDKDKGKSKGPVRT